MNRRYVLLDEWMSAEERETELRFVDESTWQALTCYRDGVTPQDSKIAQQLEEIAIRLQTHIPPTLQEREHITAQWMRKHATRAYVDRLSCVLY